MNTDRYTLWTRDFVLILLVCTIATFPNSILISVCSAGAVRLYTGSLLSGAAGDRGGHIVEG